MGFWKQKKKNNLYTGVYKKIFNWGAYLDLANNLAFSLK